MDSFTFIYFFKVASGYPSHMFDINSILFVLYQYCLSIFDIKFVGLSFEIKLRVNLLACP